jgi:radical SAM protein with 4Fe4S-binding SPASM domain
MQSDDFPVLAPGFILRKLESLIVYDIRKDELYELDEEAFSFLSKCNGKNPVSNLLMNSKDEETIGFMLDEGILLMKDGDECRNVKIPNSPIPSLRYLLLNITDRCNLVCKHCYLGNPGNMEIDKGIFEKAVSQFEEMGGLKLMISGGEPLLHSQFWELMEILPSYELRVVVLSNGTHFDESAAKKISNYVNEVQISIDGLQSHDLFRGKGSFEKAMRGINNLKMFNVPVSIATMVHKFNATEFDKMQELFSGMEVISWSVDVPCITGRLSQNKDFSLEIKEAAAYLKYGFGSGAHEGSGNYTCGSHLCAVSPDGSVSKCGFFEDEPVGTVDDLRYAWEELCRKYLFPLDKLECCECELIHDCRGGCRFRAKQYKGILAPDPLMCHANGILRFI